MSICDIVQSGSYNLVLIKNDILIEYSMRLIDKPYDGIMAPEFIHKHPNFTFVVCACYLPPDNSV